MILAGLIAGCSSPVFFDSDEQSDSGMVSSVTMGSHCSLGEVSLAVRDMITVEWTTDQAVAEACVDGARPQASQNLPYESPILMLRFMNTCGSRYCAKKGAESGKVVEITGTTVLVECYSNRISAKVGPGCAQKMDSLPKPTQFVSEDIQAVNASCVDGAHPLPADNDPNLSFSNHLRWISTCGHRACVKKGFLSGRIIEHGALAVKLECSQDNILNQLELGQLVQSISTPLDQVAASCVDSSVPNVQDNLPGRSETAAIRFFTTCGRRHCQKQGFSFGRMTSADLQQADLICLK